jgi:hypothetical protein
MSKISKVAGCLTIVLIALSACQKSIQTTTPPSPVQPAGNVQNISETNIRELKLSLPKQGQAVNVAPPGTYLLSQIRVYEQDLATNALGGFELTLEFPGVFGPGAKARRGAEWGLRQREFLAIFYVPQELSIDSRPNSMNRGRFSFENPQVFHGQFDRQGKTFFDLSPRLNTQARDLFWIFDDRYRFPARPLTRTTHYRFNGGTYNINATARLVGGLLETYIWLMSGQDLTVIKATYTPTVLDGPF